MGKEEVGKFVLEQCSVDPASKEIVCIGRVNIDGVEHRGGIKSAVILPDGRVRVNEIVGSQEVVDKVRALVNDMVIKRG